MTRQPQGGKAILLTMFGTSVETALPSLMNIHDRVQARFPGIPVHLSFSSETIRRIWKRRAADPSYRAVHPEVPEAIFTVRSPSAMLDFLSQQGIDQLIVQPVRIAPAMDEQPEEEHCSDGITAIVQEKVGAEMRIAFGRPALGPWEEKYLRSDDIIAVARSLEDDIDLARDCKAALWYMGHGNRYSSTHSMYDKLVEEIRRQYPDVLTVMSMVAGNNFVPAIIAELKENNVQNVVLKSLMIVAGNHVRNEMIGDRPDALQMQLEKEGLRVYPVLEGLGTNDAFADIFVLHVADAARDSGIDLE